jgi:hypothetical protein
LQSYAPLALASPLTDSRQDLLTQREMIVWYSDREHWMQAVSLAREWLVSWVMFHLEINSLTVLSDRHRIESVINNEATEFLKAKKVGKIFRPVSLQALPLPETVFGLWKSLTDTRNDIDHAAMRETPEKPEVLVKNIKSYIKTLFLLPI